MAIMVMMMVMMAVVTILMICDGGNCDDSGAAADYNDPYSDDGDSGGDGNGVMAVLGCQLDHSWS